MKSEINREYYCSACSNNEYPSCPRGFNMNPSNCTEYHCSARHRKYPTYDQYKKEYDEEWKGPIFVRRQIPDIGWELFANMTTLNRIIGKKKPKFECDIICACTPFGKPTNDWRPKK